MLFASKADARNMFIRKREKMSDEEVRTLGDKINSTVMRLPQYKNAKTIMLYLNFNNEICSKELIEDSFSKGRRVVIPYCKKEGLEILPTELRDVEIELERTKFGYLETKEEHLKLVDIEEIDLIIVPGLAFDKSCHRLGFGAGYYDRFLSKLGGKTETIGVAYDFQILDIIPELELTDIPLDYVVTEKRIIIKP